LLPGGENGRKLDFISFGVALWVAVATARCGEISFQLLRRTPVDRTKGEPSSTEKKLEKGPRSKKGGISQERVSHQVEGRPPNFFMVAAIRTRGVGREITEEGSVNGVDKDLQK